VEPSLNPELGVDDFSKADRKFMEQISQVDANEELSASQKEDRAKSIGQDWRTTELYPLRNAASLFNRPHL